MRRRVEATCGDGCCRAGPVGLVTIVFLQLCNSGAAGGRWVRARDPAEGGEVRVPYDEHQAQAQRWRISEEDALCSTTLAGG